MDAGPGQGRSGARSCRKTLVPLGIGGHTAKPDGQSPPWSLTITCHCFPHQARVDMGPLPKETSWKLSGPFGFTVTQYSQNFQISRVPTCDAEFGTACWHAAPNSARYVEMPRRIRHGMSPVRCEAIIRHGATHPNSARHADMRC